jgi:hypothetical protein
MILSKLPVMHGYQGSPKMSDSGSKIMLVHKLLLVTGRNVKRILRKHWLPLE